ncbi:intraflagellar transport protein 43 homolog A isoform X2 [Patella vulgata]|uniref:intraflagellar transport protein 43 homolog A isoform X2 n=1 Tax=Patella vulgata TaxID=6465 RepID=UPI00217F948E|nr:intraflagellar transport protein 43 homolog A isoform X2 [Patella vulgata]
MNDPHGTFLCKKTVNKQISKKMEEETFDLGQTKARNAKQGRRARNRKEPTQVDEDETQEEQMPPISSDNLETSGPPGRPAKAVSGWGEETPRRPRERLRPRSPAIDNDESDNDIPIIPELEDQQDEDMTSAVASAPNVAVNRVATFRELDDDLLRQAAFLTLDNEIDLKLLTKSLSPKEDLIEDDKPWDWDRLFTEVTSDLITEWEKNESTEAKEE